MAMGTAHFNEVSSSVRYGGRVGSGRGRGKHAHEVGKGLDVGNDGGIRSGGSRGRRKVLCVVWRGGEKAGRSLVAFLREQLVRDAHFHVVSFAREHKEGFVLRLPPEAGNGPIVCAPV